MRRKTFPLCRACVLARLSLNCCPLLSLFTCGLHLCLPHKPQAFLHSKFINTFPSFRGCLCKKNRNLVVEFCDSKASCESSLHFLS